jgi:hypothetical protein
MPGDLLTLSEERPLAQYMIAGWRRQWSDGGEISSGLPQYLVEKLGAKKIGEMGNQVSMMCYPFQVAGTHDAFRPKVAYRDGLPSQPMYRENYFFDGGNGLIIFLGEEPWFRTDVYGAAFFQAVRELGIKRTVAVEGYNGPAPPELERSINCVYSGAQMEATLKQYGVRFSDYGSEGRSGPTIGMALVTLAHYEYPDIEMFRLGSRAPMYPFLTANNQQVGILRDHRSFYDIMRRLKALFKLDIDLSDLKVRGDGESNRLQEMLGRIGASSPEAKNLIEMARADFTFAPFVEHVELDTVLDSTLEEIIKKVSESPDAP